MVNTILTGGVYLYFDFTIAPDVGTFFSKQGTSSEKFFVEKKEILNTLYLIIVMRIWCFTFFSTLFVILR